ncbi:hypothetical protein M378DRAFT_554441 [Amanita muscaria Koide BX008]|uniref:Uncharacterized protein n=1 Tax=Amanita muscaria (strain Koide BX008) TaxID=946122 RepID=A0A0C2WTD0_AMAMK|nr:hypothetical protein M378DRAFT_554441 [Amanita muscaria Koide BX008]
MSCVLLRDPVQDARLTNPPRPRQSINDKHCCCNLPRPIREMGAGNAERCLSYHKEDVHRTSVQQCVSSRRRSPPWVRGEMKQHYINVGRHNCQTLLYVIDILMSPPRL